MRFFVRLAFVAATFLSCASSVHAQAVRTWVSGVGDDANPCSRTAPCKTFAGAISKTAAGGEISVLDPGGFGTVTITKSISIVARGVEGSILASGTNGININAGVNDIIHLYGLSIEGANTANTGVDISQAGSVYISHTVIRGFKANAATGIAVHSATSPTRLYLYQDEINNNNIGLSIHGGSATNAVLVDSCVFDTNSSNTISLDTSTSAAAVTNSTLSQTPLAISNGAQVNSHGNNFIAGSVNPTSTVPQK